MAFSPEALAQALQALPAAPRYWVAYSGGLDSHVLLHALSALRASLPGAALCAVHVDHGLSPHAADWSRHCQAVCAALDIPCTVRRVDARPRPGESPEAAAREARYRAIEALIGPDEALLTAHHQDDQAETLLLQLLRGGGPHGLAAMPAQAPLGQGRLLRPLLGFGRVELRTYAEHHGLYWIEDESNFDTGFERNYLRHAVMPRLRARWPSVGRTLARSAGHFAALAGWLDAQAAQDLAALGAADGSLSVSGLLGLDGARRANALRAWVRAAGLPLPSAAQLEQIERALHAAPDAGPCVSWPGAELRRYRDALSLMAPLAAHDPALVLPWDLAQPLQLPAGLGRLHCAAVRGAGLSVAACAGEPLSVRFRRGGERCRPVGRGHGHALKTLFQERGVPPWERERVPLIFVGEHLAQVVGHWLCEPFAAAADEPGLRIAHTPDGD